MLHFECPQAFLLLLLAPLLYALRRVGIMRQTTLPLVLADWGGKPFEWKASLALAARLSSRLCGVLAFAALVFALAKPVLSRQEKAFTSQGTEIIFVIDTSPSMAARDMGESNRLEAARKTIGFIVDANAGASFGLVSMALDAALVVPVTSDHSAFSARLGSLAIGEMGDGTAIGTGLATAVYHACASAAPKKCIVLITDGENNAGRVHPFTAASLAAENGIALYVVGIGTRGRVPIEYIDPGSGKTISGFLDSAFDENELLKLARAGGGTYFSAENAELLLAALNDVASRQAITQSYRMVSKDTPLYGRFLLASLALFALCWLLRRLYLKEV